MGTFFYENSKSIQKGPYNGSLNIIRLFGDAVYFKLVWYKIFIRFHMD